MYIGTVHIPALKIQLWGLCKQKILARQSHKEEYLTAQPFHPIQ